VEIEAFRQAPPWIMTIKWPTINGNQLFTPTLLIFLAVIAIQLSNLQLLSGNLAYPYVFAAAVFVIFTRIFVSTFIFVEDAVTKKKPIVLAINILLTGVELATTYFAIAHLTVDTYPDITVWLLAGTQLAFAVSQVFTTRHLTRSTGINLAIYAIFSTLFYFRAFDNDAERLLLLQQSVAWAILVLEAGFLIITSHTFLDKKGE
jgi:hypothetical protein